MKRSARSTAAVLAVGIVGLVLAPVAARASAAGRSDATLPAADVGAAVGVALDHLRAHHDDMGLTVADVTAVRVTNAYRSQHNDVTHVYLGQVHRGLDVAGANATVNVNDDGTVLLAGSRFVRGLASEATGRATMDAVAAARRAARSLGLRATAAFRILRGPAGTARATVLSTGGVSQQPIPARLVYQPVAGGAVRLAWNLEIDEIGGAHWWNASIDAQTGDLLARFDYVNHENAAVTDGSSYEVYALPLESPNDGGRSVVAEPADGDASPHGWHDTDGVAGAEFTVTRGNNVHAYTDHDNDGVPDPGGDPDGGAGLDFAFPLDLSQHPHAFAPAAVSNLFYWNNIIHDVFYRYGFTEEAGNFQVDNYGAGGLGGDDVRAEAQDGGGINNANFATPVDGMRPRMQMYLWTHPRPNSVTIDPPSAAAGTYEASGAVFGPATTLAGVSGAIVLADDGVNAGSDACEPLVGFAAGSIALVDRGSCAFVVKVKNAQDAGATAVIVANNVAGNPVTLGGDDPTITIPSVMVSRAAGNTIKAGLPASGTVGRDPQRGTARDGDLDAGIIAHEYGHGISNRLTGGPATGGCLSNQEQMGEGWSDWLAMALTARPGESGPAARGLATYSLFESDRSGSGLRPSPYSTDTSINAATYDDIHTLAVPHGVGYVWATMLWEFYWNLIDKHGFNADVYADWQTGGNNLAIQLVMDGMKMQVCRPGFVDGRNAILAADEALTDGDNQCLIWRGFAKRGLGYSATQGTSTSRSDNAEAFDTHPDCRPTIEVTPASISASLVEGTQTTAGLDVGNAALTDGEDLTWTIAEAEDDCATPSDLAWLSTSPASGTTSASAQSPVDVHLDAAGLTAPDAHTGLLCVSSNDASMPTVSIPVTLQVAYPFAGFFGAVRNPPSTNDARAGSTVPAIFTLGGDRGVGVLATGSPTSTLVDCATRVAIGPATPTTTARAAGLTYDAESDRYTYPWETERVWAGTCRQLTVALDDGTEHVAMFRFRV